MRTRDKQWLAKLESLYPDMQFYSGCNEPGYDDKPVMLANWNNIPDKVYNRLERLGFSCEWEDEWVSCGECGKVVRTNPNSYGWQQSFVIFNDCELVCLECLDSSIQDYFESLHNNSRMALTVPILDKYNPENYGYKLVKDGFENGLHEWMNDDPKKILKDLLANDPNGLFMFAMDEQSQFYITFKVYQKIENEDKS
jgi:hypothetical protein